MSGPLRLASYAAAVIALSLLPSVNAQAGYVCRAFERPGIAGDAAFVTAKDGTVWYANRPGNRIVRINPDRSLTAFVPNDGATSGLSGIALGRDGNVWYTKDAANRIGRIPPAGGEGAEFEPPETKSFPASLVADRQGQLWFAARVRNYLGELGTDGSVVVHRGPKIGGRDFTPIDMALGPDGNLWTTDHGHNAIYRFDIRTKTFKRFDIPTPTAHPTAITGNGDGNVWFTMKAVRKIGRITPAGVITEFDPGDLGGGAPSDIVGTPDGTVWFSTTGRNAGRIARDGKVETFPCGSGLGTAIVAANDLPWFFDGNRAWVVEDSNAAQKSRQTASTKVAPAPWPGVAGTKSAPQVRAANIVPMRLSEAISRLPGTSGRVILQLTSSDPNCTYCVPANPRFDEIAARRANDAAFWRVSYEPWQSVGEDEDARAAQVAGIPAIIVFDNGREIARETGHFADRDLEGLMFQAAK